ncbi:MAG: nicotinate phosphoribosyltransferase [Promethearchaeota archaeon]
MVFIPIITSLLDNDLYKFTMMQAVLHHFPSTTTKYKFKCRTFGIDFKPYLKEIQDQVDYLCTLQFSDEELEYLRNLSFIKSDFIDFLQLFQLNRKHVQISMENGELSIKISGSWLLTILFEVPILAIVNEIYFQHQFSKSQKEIDYSGAEKLLKDKILLSQQMGDIFKFADFGTRRRFSRKWHRRVVEILKNSSINKINFVGTSNVHFAKMFGVKPIGTMAHEWLQAGQALDVRLVNSQKFMLQKWVDEYRGDLGIALSDVLGIDPFLQDFDKYFAKLYDGVRQDSGDPIEVCEKIIDHYKSLGIDPRTKTIIFSDGLDFSEARLLLNRFKDQIRVSFGIGTNLTNDFPDQQPLQIVIKMVECNKQPVAKISDTPEKGMCEDGKYLAYLKSVFAEKN